MRNLRLCLYSFNDKGHPCDAVRALGITWARGIPQSIADQWWFLDCKGVPDVLPPFLTDLGFGPQECVGHGLSQSDADAMMKAREGK